MGLDRVLRRVPGRELVANFSIVERDQPVRADPNGYYEILGLNPAKEHTGEEIKRAYWVRAKKFHPDGSSPNPDEFRRVQNAYLVLKDPISREKYDALDAAQRWLDDSVIAAIIKNILPLKDRKEAIEALLGGLDKPNVVTGMKAPPNRRFESYAYYYYEGEQVPAEHVREAWAALLIQEMWKRGLDGDVRLGFTTGESHAIHKAWGEVMMMAGDPNTEIVSNILEFRSPGSA